MNSLILLSYVSPLGFSVAIESPPIPSNVITQGHLIGVLAFGMAALSHLLHTIIQLQSSRSHTLEWINLAAITLTPITPDKRFHVV